MNHYIKLFLILNFAAYFISCEKSEDTSPKLPKKPAIPSKSEPVESKPDTSPKPVEVTPPEREGKPDVSPPATVSNQPTESLVSLDVNLSHSPSEVYYEPIYVAMNFTEGVSVRYTLDGSEPTEQSLLYKDPIELLESTQIKYFSHSNEKRSDINTADFKIDWIKKDLLFQVIQ